MRKFPPFHFASSCTAPTICKYPSSSFDKLLHGINAKRSIVDENFDSGMIDQHFTTNSSINPRNGITKRHHHFNKPIQMHIACRKLPQSCVETSFQVTNVQLDSTPQVYSALLSTPGRQ